MGIRVKVAIRDKVGKDFRVEEKKYIEELAERDTKRLAEETERLIKETITRKSKNPTGKLASFFYAHPITNGYAVGDIDELDSQVPGWNHLDKGSLAIGANWQHWLPKGRWENGRWVEDANGYFAMPKNPISALNYISETIAQLEVLIPLILKENK
jgi:hypothetical protein